jgi:adenosylhomocysteine nucleosidase
MEELAGLQRPMSLLPQEGPCYSFVAKMDLHTVMGAWAGCGKVAASMAATMLVERHKVDILIVSGTAGLINLDVKSPLFAVSTALQHDYGYDTYEDFKLYRPGQVPIGEVEEVEYQADPHLVEQALRLGNAKLMTCDLARIATGDQFAGDARCTESIRAHTLCTLVDMETAAVAQVANAYDIPWVAIKAVSDEGSAEDFTLNLKIASRRSTVLTERLIESL